MWTKQQPQTEPSAVPPATGTRILSKHLLAHPPPLARAVSTARNSARLGSSLQIKGHITGTEDLQIDGKVEGSISLRGHQLTVGFRCPAHFRNSRRRSGRFTAKVVGNVHCARSRRRQDGWLSRR